MLLARLSPPVRSFTLASRKGVMSLPWTPASSAALRAWRMTPSILPKSRPYSSGMGLAMSTPPLRPMPHLALRMSAAS